LLKYKPYTREFVRSHKLLCIKGEEYTIVYALKEKNTLIVLKPYKRLTKTKTKTKTKNKNKNKNKNKKTKTKNKNKKRGGRYKFK
jgi:thiamine monophosphate kinase